MTCFNDHGREFGQEPHPKVADRPLAFQIVEAPVEFCTLRLGERNRLGHRPKAVPQLLQQVEPLFGCQRSDVRPTLAHGRSITSRGACPQHWEPDCRFTPHLIIRRAVGQLRRVPDVQQLL